MSSRFRNAPLLFPIHDCFLGLNPIIQLFVFCTTKDVLCSSFVMLYISLLFSTSNNETISKRMTVILALLVFLIAALRSNAAIALLLSASIQLFLMSKKIRNRLFRKLDGVDFVRQPAILVDPSSITNAEIGTAESHRLHQQQSQRLPYDIWRPTGKSTLPLSYRNNVSNAATTRFVAPSKEEHERIAYLGYRTDLQCSALPGTMP